jgi:hypothetical protein
MQIISSRNPLDNLSSQEDWASEYFTAFGTSLKSMLLYTAIPNTAP